MITGFTQSPQLPYWINAGVYDLGAEAIERLPQHGDHEDTTIPGIRGGEAIGGCRIEGYWRGIDTLKDVREVTNDLNRMD